MSISSIASDAWMSPVQMPSGLDQAASAFPAGLSGTETFEIADLAPVAVGTPTFTAA